MGLAGLGKGRVGYSLRFGFHEPVSPTGGLRQNACKKQTEKKVPLIAFVLDNVGE